MTNVEVTPNYLKHRDDHSGGHAYFGPIHSMTGISLPGAGHRPHVQIHFRGGVCIDLDPATASELARRLPASLLSLNAIPEVSGAVVDLEGTA